MAPKIIPLADKIAKYVSPLNENECWEYSGPRTGKGYGTMTLGKSKQLLAHRVAYELAKGPVWWRHKACGAVQTGP